MKTAKFNIKDVLGKLNFLKNNLALLVPILIAVVAVLLFIPTRILRGKLQAQIQQQSVQPGQRVTRLIKDASKAGEAAALERYVNEFAKDANLVELLAKQTTWRELLTYKLFPDTNERSTLLFEEVRQKYISGVEAMLQDKNMAAGTPPSNAEIEAALKNAPRPPGYTSGYAGAYGPGGGMMPTTPGTPGYSQQRSWAIVTETDHKIFDKVCEDKARAAKVYVDPMSLDGYQYWNEWKFEDRDKAYRACWYWQLGYWILEDVAATVREINKNAQSVLDAPVKRVMNVSFNQKRMRGGYPGMMGMGMRRGGMRRTDKDKQGPVYVTSAKDAMASPPCTGRFTGEENDIVHFSVRVILTEDQVMPFIQQLCSAKEHKFRGFYGDLPEQTYKHNQITVLESALSPVNPEDWEHYLCRYGTDVPFELDLICEYLLHGKAYEEIKPQQVKDDIVNAGQKKQPGQR